mmetsp:Transcript_2849/g.4350  ORF Transcript_2849/g.4350 Transcript_2849/m.4350 type:complete len:350 (+) Transcript_2849:43-1092(+)
MRNYTVSFVLATVLQLGIIPQCDSFSPTFVGGFQLPKFDLPWFSSDDSAPAGDNDTSSLKPGDTIAVIGASGNVGKLVALRLSDTYKVNGIVRDASSVQEFFQGREDRIQLFESDLLVEDIESLAPALKNANAIVICTGTTAFPTDAWSRSGEFSVKDQVLKALLDNKFSVKDALSDLDNLGLNTPNNVDARSNQVLLKAWKEVCNVPKKRAIMLSSIGVQRRDSMPFPILNACGVLDAKAAGEEALVNSAVEEGYSYTIVRPGQLFGGPYDNNYYLGTLFQLDKDASTQDVNVGKGDELLGDTLRSTLAEITAQICEGNCALDMDFAAVNVKGDAPSVEMVQERLQAL